jgi:hypothetical protein
MRLHHAFGAVLMTGAELKFLAKRRNPQPALQLLAALSSQAYEFETFIAAEHFISWIIFQVERGNDGTCDGNAQEIFDFNPRLCLHGPRKTACDCAQRRRKRTERKAQFFAKSQIGGRSWAKGRTERKSRQAQLFAQSRARIGGRPEGRTCLAPRADPRLRRPS